MQKLTFSINPKNGKELHILCLGAHCDDIEIGCGGTILKLIEDYEKVNVRWIVFASNETRKNEALQSAEHFLKGANRKDVRVHAFNDGYLPSAWSDVKNVFEDIKTDYTPDLIFTHYRDDLHQDHRTLNELTWNTFRNHLILEYEITKYDGDTGNPNLFVSLEKSQLEKRNRILISCFKSQLNKQWFDEPLLMALPRLRGVQCASATGYAEAFYARKVAL